MAGIVNATGCIVGIKRASLNFPRLLAYSPRSMPFNESPTSISTGMSLLVAHDIEEFHASDTVPRWLRLFAAAADLANNTFWLALGNRRRFAHLAVVPRRSIGHRRWIPYRRATHRCQQPSPAGVAAAVAVAAAGVAAAARQAVADSAPAGRAGRVGGRFPTLAVAELAEADWPALAPEAVPERSSIVPRPLLIPVLHAQNPDDAQAEGAMGRGILA